MDTKRQHCNIMQSQPTPPPLPRFQYKQQDFNIQTIQRFFRRKRLFLQIYSAAKSVWNGKDGGNYHEDKMIITKPKLF